MAIATLLAPQDLLYTEKGEKTKGQSNCNLPRPLETPSPPLYNCLHLTLSFVCLGRGSEGMDYQGHIFWDMETWIYPVILLLQPSAAKDMLNYRVNRMSEAYERARVDGYAGLRFPWESAFTGKIKRVTLVDLYHVNRCGHYKKLSIAKLDFVQVCGLSLNFYNNTLRKFYKFSDSRKT